MPWVDNNTGRWPSWLNVGSFRSSDLELIVYAQNYVTYRLEDNAVK